MSEVQIDSQRISISYDETVFAENDPSGCLSQAGTTQTGLIPLSDGPERIRVLHAVESFSTGVLQCIALICDALKDEASFAILHGSREEMPNDFQRYFPSDTLFVPWSAAREISPSGDRRAMTELAGLIAEWKPDIIHAHSSKAGALCRVLNWRNANPVVYSPHGYSFLRQDLSWLKRQTYRLIERSLGKLPHLTVAVGVDELLQASSVARAHLLIPNMVDTVELNQHRKVHRKPGPLRVAMMGGIRPQKNFSLFADIATRFADSGVEFVWIGGGDVPSGLRVPDNVTITGWLKRHDALSALSEADVFFQTSLWEGLPLSVLEAMALALPVLATPAAGNTELVIDGVNGYVCSRPSQFETRLREFAINPDLRLRLGDEGRRFVARFHSTEAIASRWSSLYHGYERYSAAPSLTHLVV